MCISLRTVSQLVSAEMNLITFCDYNITLTVGGGANRFVNSVWPSVVISVKVSHHCSQLLTRTFAWSFIYPPVHLPFLSLSSSFVFGLLVSSSIYRSIYGPSFIILHLFCSIYCLLSSGLSFSSIVLLIYRL